VGTKWCRRYERRVCEKKKSNEGKKRGSSFGNLHLREGGEEKGKKPPEGGVASSEDDKGKSSVIFTSLYPYPSCGGKDSRTEVKRKELHSCGEEEKGKERNGFLLLFEGWGKQTVLTSRKGKKMPNFHII